MVSAMSLFKTIMIVQLFYAFFITGAVYVLPADTLGYVDGFSDFSSPVDLEGVTSEVQDSLERQTNIPVVELGALVFYSGNILIDLMLNFAFAVPEMIGMFVNGIMMIFNLDNYIFALVQLFASAVVTVLYFLGVMEVLLGIRSGRTVV